MIQGYSKLLRNTAVAWMLLSAGSFALAQTKVENLFKNPRFGSAVLSPNGKHLATTANISGRLQLAVVDLETGVARNVAG